MQTALATGNVLFPFTGGWTFHFEMQRRSAGGYPRPTGADPVSELIDGERRARLGGTGCQRRTRTFVAITDTPSRPTTAGGPKGRSHP